MKTGLQCTRRAFLGLTVLAALQACGTAEDAKVARGQGVKRTFKQPFDEVYAVALLAAERRQLEIVSATRESGTILLSSRPSLSSLGGERIALFVTRLGERTSTAEIVVRTGVAAVSFPRDWPGLLFGEMEDELAARRLKR
jgi:hypothetical protein